MNKKSTLVGKLLVVGIFIFLIGASLVSGYVSNFVRDNVNNNNPNNSNSSSTIDWWPMFHHDLNNSGYSTSPYAPEANNVLWTYQTDYMVSSSPVIYNNKVYIGGLDEYLYCLDTKTGALIWKDFVPGAGSDPCVADGKVILGSTYDYIYCWDADTGEKIWRFYKDYGGSDKPAVSDGKVYITYSQQNNKNFYGKISCLNIDNGTEFWNRIFIDGTINHVAVYNGKVIVPHYYGKLYCLDGETGEIIWEANTGGAYGTPAIVNGKVYASADGIKCLDVDTGDEIWHYIGEWSYCSPAVSYNKVYYVSSDGKVICLDAYTGYEVWTYIIGSEYEHAFSSPAIADGKVYVGIWSNGNLLCLNASNGEFIWDYPVSPGNPGHLSSSPAIANGRLYIGSMLTGKVFCFGNSSTPPDLPIINSPTKIKVGTSNNFTFNSLDPEGDDVYYYIEWGDGNAELWIGPHPSGMDFEIAHTYVKRGKYTIKAKAIDIYGYESDWSEFEITILRSRLSNHWILELIYRFLMREVIIC
ncbi:hypothetical protein AYK21_02900 [Thermoplasmatales archaeon SG8-52-2]|nr:MAG: hypothetical protein AYK21_02900 [Thermoplasmatales archaeon SG8-52-2]